MKIYEYCPSCNHKEIRVVKQYPKVNRFGTDGWGQPVRFTDCQCGSNFKGYLNLEWYTEQGEKEDDENLLSYLRHRIDFYYEGFTQREGDING